MIHRQQTLFFSLSFVLFFIFTLRTWLCRIKPGDCMMAFSSSIIMSRNEKLCYNDHSLTFFFSLLSSNCYGGYSGKQQSSIEHDHLNAIHAYTSSFVLVKWILITIGKKKRTKKAITRVRSVSFASKDRLQRACLHSVPYDSFFFLYSFRERKR